MIINELYDPFKSVDLVGSKCFLTGKPITKELNSMFVFPNWLMDSENLHDNAFKMLDESYLTYAHLKLPVSNEVFEKIEILNEKIKSFLLNDNSESITEIEWFQWTGIILYGLIHNEIKNGVKSEEYKEEGFKISPILIKKFKHLHFQLQSLILDVEWDEPLPFSLVVFKIDSSDETSYHFEHKNEINTLTFSLKYKNCGLIICLQDLGMNANYHKSIVSKINSSTLLPIQFAELSAMFYYSNYLLSVINDFDYTFHKNKLYITNIDSNYSGKSPFENWDEKTFAQVLEAFWKPWKYSRIEILKNAEKCMSFLLNENH
jgi:hypothetical protein